jgi:predicted alpha/beta-fold hydrolase
MPISQPSFFEPPIYTLRNGHLQTILPSLFRKIEIQYQRERIETPDGDFLDIDWAIKPNLTPLQNSQTQVTPNQVNNKLAIVLHGLEGSSQRHYVTGMIKALHTLGYDGLALNFRSCSGEMNRLLRYYHHGDSQDVHTMIRHVEQTRPQYTEIILVGFSMGGNIVLKYFGESGQYLPASIKKGLAFSVPLHLSSCSDELAKPNKWFYTKNFLISLKQRLVAKAAAFPNEPLIDTKNFDKLPNLREFDNRYTSKLHGFKDAEDYYQKCSSINYMEGIRRPVLLVNALDDPFLTSLCYPTEFAENNEYLHFETPKFGGHVGFEIHNTTISYGEKRALEWFK